jgi:hypothetical protein
MLPVNLRIARPDQDAALVPVPPEAEMFLTFVSHFEKPIHGGSSRPSGSHRHRAFGWEGP